MATQLKLELTKTYASEENAVKAFEKKFGNTDIRYLVLRTDDNRFYPAALGEKALGFGVHHYFHVIG